MNSSRYCIKCGCELTRVWKFNKFSYSSGIAIFKLYEKCPRSRRCFDGHTSGYRMYDYGDDSMVVFFEEGEIPKGDFYEVPKGDFCEVPERGCKQ